MERLQAHFRGLVQAMEAGAYRTGCLLGNLAGGPTPPPALNAGLRAGFDGWVDDLTDVLEEIGHPRPRASSLARGIVMAWEGAMLLMRIEHTAAPLDTFVQTWLGETGLVRVPA